MKVPHVFDKRFASALKATGVALTKQFVRNSIGTYLMFAHASAVRGVFASLSVHLPRIMLAA